MVSTGLVMALVGSFLTMLVVSILLHYESLIYFGIIVPDVIFEILQTFILPCACFLSIVRGKITRLQVIKWQFYPLVIQWLFQFKIVYLHCFIHVPVKHISWWFLFKFTSIVEPGTKCQIKFDQKDWTAKLHTVISYGQCMFTNHYSNQIIFTRIIYFVSGDGLHFDYCSWRCIRWHRHIFISCSNHTKLEVNKLGPLIQREYKNFVDSICLWYIVISILDWMLQNFHHLCCYYSNDQLGLVRYLFIYSAFSEKTNINA